MPSTELPQTSFAVLGLLSFHAMSGYDLKQFADRSIGHFYWSPAKSQIYAELRRLRKEGLVTEEHVEQDSRPDKRVYAITPAGRERLTSWVNGGDYEPDVFKSTLLLKMFLGRSGDPEALINLVEQCRSFCSGQVAMLREMERCFTDPEYDGHDPLFSLITIRAGIHFAESNIVWADETLADLRARSVGEDL